MSETADSVVRDVVCTECGCLCDDLIVTVRSGRIVDAENACDRGRVHFLSEQSGLIEPDALIDGRPAGRDEAVERAAVILGRARAPVVLGLVHSATESVASAIAIADRIGAAIDVGVGRGALNRLLALQTIGRVSATLGEVKNRADVVVFWGVDPVNSHPRHWERYSVGPQGRFVPRGRAERTVIVVDSQRTATAQRSDLFVECARERQFELLWVLRAIVRGITLSQVDVESATGVDIGFVSDLARRLQAARYGALFFGESLDAGPRGASHVEAVLALVRDLNSSSRFVALHLGAPGNAPGAEAVLTWQSGLAQAVDFAPGYPVSLAGETSAVERLARGEADAALIVGRDVRPELPAATRACLAQIPSIVVVPRATATPDAATVVLNASTYGIDAPGTVTRTDGLVLPLRPVLPPRCPFEREWLDMIGERLKGVHSGSVMNEASRS